MQTIGLLGGMSWESTLAYYRAINQGVKEKLGGLHSAKIVMVSVDFDPIEKLQHQGDWVRPISCPGRPGILKRLRRIFSSSAPIPCIRWHPRSSPG